MISTARMLFLLRPHYIW